MADRQPDWLHAPGPSPVAVKTGISPIVVVEKADMTAILQEYKKFFQKNTDRK